MRIIAPPKQDEANPMLKSLYVCETKGCGYVHEKKRKFCEDCMDKTVRAEIEKEYAELTNRKAL